MVGKIQLFCLTLFSCAFANTPKYNQVAGKGRIVNGKWISDCHSGKKSIPWRNYRVGKAKSPATSSDEDEEEEEVNDVTNNSRGAGSSSSNQAQGSSSRLFIRFCLFVKFDSFFPFF